jgi:hypothetical protein
MKNWKACICILVSSCLMTSVSAQQKTVRLDDRGTFVSENLVKMVWTTRQEEMHAVNGGLKVFVRLNVAPWKGKRVKIYMGVDPLEVKGTSITWSTTEKMGAGVLRPRWKSSERALVYQGLVDQETMSDTLSMEIRADGRSYQQTMQMNFFFELEE